MTHKDYSTRTYADPLVIAISGHTGYVGRIVLDELNSVGVSYYKIPSFRELTATELNLKAPLGKIVLINCSGSTPKRNPEMNCNIYKDNVESLEKLMNAFAHRMHSVLHMSTTHLNTPENVTKYTEAKKYSEVYLNQVAAKFSLTGLNLRLPTIWSSEYMKVESLLDDITTGVLQERENRIRLPEAIVHIAPAKSLGIQVRHFLNGDFGKIGFDDSNSWIGNIDQLIHTLKTKEVFSSSTENELKRIFQHWTIQRTNS